jgi:phosphoadenosine phosphosulfate reductase
MTTLSLPLPPEPLGGDAERTARFLAWALERWGGRVALASSFGAEDMVLVDLLAGISRQARVFVLDTGRLHQETYELVDRVRERYGIVVEALFPAAAAVEAFVRERGFDGFRRSVADRKRCCGIRKVEPLGRALAGLDAWITGLRREQAVTRTLVEAVEADPEHGDMVKLNPLVGWSNDQVWDYLRSRQVPWNPLHDRGFPSIGCACCTRAVRPGEDLRAGRWWWEAPEQKECGLHAPKPG